MGAMVNDPLGDLIARIRNAAMRKRDKVSTPASKMRGRVLEVLQDEGYIRGFTLVEEPGQHPTYEIELKYFDNEPVIAEIARVSKPGRRVYSSIKDLKPIKNGLGISILSTPKGVMSDNAARDANVGGEVLCRVY
jgi:small subunit ribosomal protein S8